MERINPHKYTNDFIDETLRTIPLETPPAALYSKILSGLPEREEITFKVQAIDIVISLGFGLGIVVVLALLQSTPYFKAGMAQFFWFLEWIQYNWFMKVSNVFSILIIIAMGALVACVSKFRSDY